jgi:hypothetical protein
VTTNDLLWMNLLKKPFMNYQILLPACFNSNIYVYQQKLSEKLSQLVRYRLDLENIPHSLEFQIELDKLLQSQHFRFIDIRKTIENIETDSFAFGSNCWNSLTRNAINIEVVDPIVINNDSK